MKIYRAIGLMSGTSLDGLDICYVQFEFPKVENFRIISAETVPYDDFWKKRLKNSIHLTAEELTRLDFDFGDYCGKIVKKFIDRHSLQSLDFISSHGHTVFHNPTKHYTLQIGKGQGIAIETGLRTVYDFRSQDVLLGGQGAPLVPIGDQMLFGEFDACLNLGGFSNISFEKDSKRLAFDISAFNVVLNYLAEKKGKSYDAEGKLAQSGNVLEDLLITLNEIDYYKQQPPKSLGIEFVHEFFSSILDKAQTKPVDQLATFTEHFAQQMAIVINENQLKTVLVTGGGAYNRFFISLLQSKIEGELILPHPLLIDYKEALVFALMGLLRVENQTNVLKSVTGAWKNHSSGVVVG